MDTDYIVYGLIPGISVIPEKLAAKVAVPCTSVLAWQIKEATLAGSSIPLLMFEECKCKYKECY